MDKDKNSLTSIRDVIANLLSDGALPFNPDDAHIWKVWDEVVGPDISRNAKPLWIKDRRLKVTVSDPIWLQELKFVEKDIKEKLNKKLGRKAVEKIEFRVGPK
jgi:predicted nucleic acid-binding Zn ribbon protein